MGSVQPPTKPCHNCRRQRLRCDRSYPHCNKCAASGKECLGYGKLFRWTGAIASRGKLAGRTSSAPVGAGDAEDADAGVDGDARSEAGAVSPVVSPIVRSRTSSPQAVTLNGSFARRSSTGAGALQVISQPVSPSAKLRSPWVLVDPLFQGLDKSHRFYLDYFTTRVCKDLVSNDGPQCNPFRSLIPLTRAHPLLQHIIVAASAAHMSNLIRMGLPYPDGGFIPANRDAASTRALDDALVAKHTALKLMSTAIQNLDTINDCFIYFILASAFMPARYAASLNFESSQIPFVLGKTVANSYLCCPPELMEILHEASQLSNSVLGDESNEAATIAALELINRAQAYDIYAWARDTARALGLPNDVMQSRMHAGASHRLAACIYILQAIPSAGERLGPEFAAFLTDDLLAHLNMMPVEDPNFKATTWPTFIIGAETRDPVRQKFIMERLRIMTTVCPWGFIHTAMETLQVIWNLAAEERGSKSWVQTLKDPEMNFLIV
ncbi:hypothetical protein TrVFT333_010243 [Trichoderma virens FT-333]|nr:hypothetical protein TrVFT333_010243 [Trichoderma virens FT-333]